MPEIDDFTAGAAMAIAYLSVIKITGSGEPIEPLATLDKYNMKNEDTPSVKQNILNNNEFGLPHYKHEMNPNAIKDLSPGWKLQGLADIIFDNATPIGAAMPGFAARMRSPQRSTASAPSSASTNPSSAVSTLQGQMPVVAISAALGLFVGLWLGSRR